MNRRQVLGLVLFCFIGGSGWLVDSALPSTLPSFEQTGLHYFIVSVVAIVLWFVRRRPVVSKRSSGVRLAAASLLLLALPELLNEQAHAVTAETRVALFALVPLCVVVGAASLNRDSAGSSQGRSLMMPALIGFSGALLVLPFRFPSTVAHTASFSLVILAVLFTAVGSIWNAQLLHGWSLALATAMACGANALVFGSAALSHGLVAPTSSELLIEVLRSVLLDLPLLFLLVWLLRELPPAWFATRFFLVPLLSAAEGAVVLRAPIGLRMATGMLLMAAGSAAILLWRGRTEEDKATIFELR